MIVSVLFRAGLFWYSGLENGEKLMVKIRLLIAMIVMAGALSACATLQGGALTGPDHVAHVFFNNLRKPDSPAAYGLFARGLSQRIAPDRFDALVAAMISQWGRLIDEEAIEMPFHKRPGEQNFIPFGIDAEKIKRYVFEIRFERAEINCALTIVPQDDQYKIVWIAFWGDSAYLTPVIQEKMESLLAQLFDGIE